MTKLVLFGVDISPPVRACLLTLNALGVPFEYKIVDLFNREHLSEEFVKRNPQHTVPLLDDDGTWIYDSHAICSYLVDKFGGDEHESLYPRDLAKRAIVQQRMYFDASILFMALRNISMPMFRHQITVVPKEKTDNVVEGFELVEAFLAESSYIAGDSLTIADFCCVATVTSLEGIVKIDAAKYPKIAAWIDRVAKLPFYEECNGKGLKAYVDILKNTLTDIQV